MGMLIAYHGFFLQVEFIMSRELCLSVLDFDYFISIYRTNCLRALLVRRFYTCDVHSHFLDFSLESLSATGADAKGYFGRAVPYTNVHTSPLQTYYNLEVVMAAKRLPQPVPK